MKKKKKKATTKKKKNKKKKKKRSWERERQRQFVANRDNSSSVNCRTKNTRDI